MWRSLFFSTVVFFLFGNFVFAQTLHQDVQERLSAEVLEVVSEKEREITGTNATAKVQDVRVVIKEGDRAGEVVRFEVELVELKKGDNIHIYRIETITGREEFSYADYERRSTLIFVSIVFVLLLLLLTKWQGVRALLSLVGSVAAIVFLLIPALLAGYDPVLSSIGIAGAVLAMVLFVTHGVTARSVIAFAGTFLAVSITGLVALISASSMKLSGFSSDASVYLNFATNGSLDLSGLLLGSIIIGILGVLDDVSITQASVVQELKFANKGLGAKELYLRAIKVGRDHIGSLVNTLALAYVGVSLPLILLYAKADSSVWLTLNQEVVAAEILRIVVGSIGLVLAVPFTTAVAAWYWDNREVKEETDFNHCGHHH